MICKGIAATTHIDTHNTRIAKEALERAADDISSGEYVPSVGVEHDLTIMPIGKVYKAYVDKLSDGEYALHIEQEIFEKAYAFVVDDEKYILTKSDVDNRPFASDEIEANERLTIGTDPVNFENFEKASEYLSNLKNEFDIETNYLARKSAIPDPELVFNFAGNFITYLLIYLSGKQVIERVGDVLVDAVLSELREGYEVVKKAISSGSAYLLPKTRPVTYIFRGNLNFLVEFVVKTNNPDTAITAVGASKLKEAFDKIDNIKDQFSTLQKVQFLFNEIEDRWEFNYLTTEKGEVIGTEKSYSRSAKLVDLYFKNTDKTNVSIGSLL